MFRKKHGGLDDEQIDGAATTIQASFKGHQTRKKFKTRKIEKGIYKKNYRQEIDLLDPDILSYATDIQAGLSDRNKNKTKISDLVQIFWVKAVLQDLSGKDGSADKDKHDTRIDDQEKLQEER